MRFKSNFLSCVFLGLFIISNVNTHAQVLITNILKNEYKAFSKNWVVDFDKQGVAYFGNEAGLLTYDGFNWDLNTLPGNLTVRSVLVKDDRVYTGSFEQFGYWSKANNGRLKYTSLSKQILRKTLHNDMIWKIIFDDKGGIIFQSFNTLYYYNGETVKNIEINHGIIFLLKVRDRIIAQETRGNLLEFVDGEFKEIEGSNVLNRAYVRVFLPFGKDKFLLGSATKGLYIWDSGSGFREWNCEAQQLIKEAEINAGYFDGKRYYIGTINKGVFVIKPSGQLVSHLYKENGLEGNTVLGLKTDSKNRLWLALNRGLSCIEFDFPLHYVTNRSSYMGVVHAVEIYKNKVYVGSNQGLFYCDLNKKDLFDLEQDDFQLIPELKGQVWSLKNTGGKLLCGHNTGIYELDGKTIKLIKDIGGGRAFSSFRFKDNDYLLINTFTSLLLLEQDKDGAFSRPISLRGFFEPSRNLVVDPQNNLWISHVRRKEVFNVKVQDIETPVVKSRYGIRKGLPQNYGNKVFDFNDRIVFATQEGLYTYDELNDTIVSYHVFDKQLGEYAHPASIVKYGNDKYWFSIPPKVALVELKNDSLSKVFEYTFNHPYSSLDERNPTILPLNDSITAFCLENGFALFNKNHNKQHSSKTDSIYFKNIVYSGSKNQILNNAIEKQELITLPFKMNKITFEFVSNSSISALDKFRYKLTGYDEEWIDAGKNNKVTYERLDWGEYTFVVQGEDEYGNKLIPATQQIIIEVPFYAQTWFIIFVILAFIGISIWLGKESVKYISHQNQITLEQKNKEWEEKHEEEKRLSGEKLMKLKNELLKKEIQHQSTELANRTIATIKRKEVLSQVKEEILKQREHLKFSYPEKYLERLLRMIDNSIEDEDDWKVFRAHFDKAHDNFFKRLKQEFEDLTPKDLRLCAYLKMNLSTKEIAPLMNVSPRSVEVHRYKLRKKLGLKSEDNLTEFMISY